MRVDGWMLRIDRPFEEFELRVDGRTVSRQAAMDLEKVARAFPWIPHARRSGFSFLHPVQEPNGTIEIVGLSHGGPAGRLRTVFSSDPSRLGPLPPLALRLRVAGVEEADSFRADGQRTFSDFSAAVERHGGFGRVRRMLDWGCGCARVTAFFLADGRVPEVHGTDIDGEAIDWCRDALPLGTFQQSGPFPPLPFPDGFFDLVVAFSVFTHLPARVQRDWLAEIRRIVTPGGLFLATFHGEFAALFSFPERPPRSLGERLRKAIGRPRVLEDEIVDSVPDHALDGIAPEAYYRSVFQTRRYTIRECSRFFEVREYIEAGAGTFQDLVVLKKPG